MVGPCMRVEASRLKYMYSVDVCVYVASVEVGIAGRSKVRQRRTWDNLRV